jgi:hypothetical protein
MTREHVASLLEIASFFLVSLDLYGEDRLNGLTERALKLVKRLERRIEQPVTAKEQTHYSTLRKALALPLFIAICISLALVRHFLVLPIEDDIYSPNAMVMVADGLREGIIWIIAELALLLSIASVIFAYLLFARIAYMALRKYELSGLMMISGTILFGVAKYLAW